MIFNWLKSMFVSNTKSLENKIFIFWCKIILKKASYQYCIRCCHRWHCSHWSASRLSRTDLVCTLYAAVVWHFASLSINPAFFLFYLYKYLIIHIFFNTDAELTKHMVPIWLGPDMSKTTIWLFRYDHVPIWPDTHRWCNS